MACFVPFNSRNLDISLFAFRATIVDVDDLVEGLKRLCLSISNLGCVHSAIFKSIHGNMIVWYGSWTKRSDENKESLNAVLLSMLNKLSNMAILLDHCFFEAYAGQSRTGSPAAKFFTGDIISMYSATLSSTDTTSSNRDKLSYAALSIFRSHFLKMNGANAGVCLKSSQSFINPRIVGFAVWKSLQFCYSYILNSDHRENVLPYVDGLQLDVKYDVFRVVYVSKENSIDSRFDLQYKLLHSEMESNDGYI